MLTVYKYAIPFTDEFKLRLPAGAQPLSAGEQHGEIQMWALVDPAAPSMERMFRLAGTGHPIDHAPGALLFVGTVQLRNGLVFHLFEVTD